MTSAITLPPVWKSATKAKPCPRLIVTDDKSSHTHTLLEIFQTDHDVIIAGNGIQAMAACQSSMPDLILLDSAMPDMDGIEACRKLKSDLNTKDIPVILMIRRDDLEAETRALAAGAADVITKPVNPSIVRARVNTHLALKAQKYLLESLSFIDGLTGAANRRRFDEAIEAEWRRCRRLISPLALLMIDIDHFKKYNDSYGHLAGDKCLQEVATILKGQIGRSHDLLARYSGEEFVCLLPDIYFDGAMQKAEAMIWAVRDRGMPHGASATASVVTISVGVVVTIPGPDRQAAEVISLVEAQLSEAKRQGRNQVCGQELAGYFSNSLR